MVVKTELTKLGLNSIAIGLGEVEFVQKTIKCKQSDELKK